MPELPEVETIRLGLERELVGRTIERAHWRPTNLRGASPMPLDRLATRRLGPVHRHGKFLRWNLDAGYEWVIHLGMTGKLLFAQPEEPELPHTHLVLDLDDGRQLRYSDPRRFGALKLYGPGDPVTDVAHYGPDALDAAFDPAHLETLLRTSRAPLKAFLLDQTKIAGIGNIYACEALWHARLSPRRKACNTPRSKVAPLHAGILKTLHDSLAQGGTSFNDYVNTIGEPGTFIANLHVFMREGQPCTRCGPSSEVRRIVQSNRSTYHCPGCQR